MRLALCFGRGEQRRRLRRLSVAAWITAFVSNGLFAQNSNGLLAQKTLTWDDAKREFEATNPTLLASRVGVQESRAQEITAYLRPNPEFTASVDQLNPFTGNPYRPLGFALPLVSVSYLVERQ